jgi:hypothetical protein
LLSRVERDKTLGEIVNSQLPESAGSAQSVKTTRASSS